MMFTLLTETVPSDGFTIASFIEVISTLWTTFIGFIGDVLQLVTNHPLLLLVIGLPFASIGFTMFRKLINSVRGI